MKVHLYVLTMFLGVVLAVHLAMNGKVGAVMNNPRVANAVFWCIGAVTAVAIGSPVGAAARSRRWDR
jgi:bacterial/archaeal transporter family-2 protein